MRVLLDARVTVGGVGTYGRDLTAGLSAIEDVEATVVHVPDPLSGRLRMQPFTPWGRAAVARRAARERVDVVHGLHLEIPRMVIPAVLTVHDLIPVEHPASMPNVLRRSVFRSILSRSLQRATRVVVPSPSTRAALERWGPSPPIEVIPHGVSRRFRQLSAAERQAARRRYAGGAPYIAAIASPKAHKNLPVSLRVGQLVEREVGVRLVLVGPEANDARTHSFRYLSDDDLASFLGGAEIFLSTSLVEGFGLPALEAAACGTPVVCGAGTGAVPFLGSSVEIVDVTDPSSIATTVVSLLQDDRARSEMALAGVGAASELTLERMAARTARVYREVVNASP